MKIINPSFEILEQKEGLEGIYEAIETAGRTCYKSERPAGSTAKSFVDRLIANKHLAMAEFGTIYLKIPKKVINNPFETEDLIELVSNIHTATFEDKEYTYITSNYRVILETDVSPSFIEQYLCNPTEKHEQRVAVKFITSIGIAREFCRHRVFSFAQESTRYCNYSKNRFDNKLTFIAPYWWKYPNGKSRDINGKSSNDVMFKFSRFAQACQDAETYYFGLLQTGCTPQEAREVLPLALKTELVMSGFVSDWQHFFNLRTSIIAETGNPHPDAARLADPLYEEFINRKLIYAQK
jgi:thymidylate synthase (FAD)